MIEDEELLKKCSKCGEWKPISEFYKDKRSNDGLQSKCKKCRKDYYENNKEKIKEYYENNKEKIKEQQKEYNKNNYVRRWCYNTINKHKNRSYIVNITFDELYNIVKDEPICEICGKELEWYSTGKGKLTNLSPSLDRIYNENEINKDNISILCHKCNMKKNSESIEENLVWCKQFEEYANKKLRK